MSHFNIIEVRLVESDYGPTESARPYYKAHIHGAEGGVVEMHLADPETDYVEMEIMGVDDDTIIVDPASLALARDRLLALSRG